MRDLLLDINIIVDLCVERAGSANSRIALAVAKERDVRLWTYAGSVQTMEYVVAAELHERARGNDRAISASAARRQARVLLGKLTTGMQWLAALASECDVFAEDDPEDAQLIRSLERMPGTSRLLTRDKRLLAQHPEKTTTPESLIQQALKNPAEPAIDFIDLKAQQASIRPQLERNIHRVLHHGQYIMGPEIQELEERLADYVEVEHCITCASGTDSLLIAMLALGIGPGDEIITTPFTFIATGEMIALLGARPVFVDIDPPTYNIDPTKIEAAITPNTRAIIPVSLYGQPADFDEINAIAQRHGLPVIEDGAQSFGATYKARKSGALSAIGSTSFFPSKPLGGYGDGGALFTNDDALAKAMREIRVHGQDRRYNHPRIGINGRLDTLQAAVILAKLDRFDDEIAARQQVAARYNQWLAGSEILTTPYKAPDRTHVYAQYSIEVDNREALQAVLKAQNIPTAVHYPLGLHRQPAFNALGQAEARFPHTNSAAQRIMSLPMHPYLTARQQQQVVDALVNPNMANCAP
ncbi:aminotransferase class V-fold PLP-dependent enzyme [Magnetovirga frankeli]|uniref:DegT/DnrJ/EryC1/StrS family aminotransferase n=1 Tax=Magnetovirga frankeli TaxID=947516 RepID=UPI0012938961|nr:aminotransferase class V-fold PLP-dependent enzyme [gamma proteobacterium SS-5]